jgi:hypothetical protein
MHGKELFEIAVIRRANWKRNSEVDDLESTDDGLTLHGVSDAVSGAEIADDKDGMRTEPDGTALNLAMKCISVGYGLQ